MPHPIRFTALLFLSFLVLAPLSPSASSSSLEDDVKVIVYKGPKPSECTTPPTDKNKPLKVESGHTVGLHFTVTIDPSSSNGVKNHKVESSHDRGIAPSFPVGKNKVIQGLDRGIVGLCKGSKAYIIIPPHLAYGKRGVPEQGVPGDTTLRYDVEILDIQPPTPNEFEKVDVDGDWKLSREEAEIYFDKKGQAIDLDLLWKEEDADGDGYISWEEFGGPKGDELPPHLEQQRRQDQRQAQQKNEALAQAVAIFQQIAGDDEKISKEELSQFFTSVGQQLTEEFWRESDLDGDSYVSLVEWLGPEAKTDSGGPREGSEL